MKRKYFVAWLVIIFTAINGLITNSSLASPLEGDTLILTVVKLNGTVQQDSLFLLISDPGPQVEAGNFMQLVGDTSYPISNLFHQEGIVVQYGRYISYTRLGFAQGFVNLKMVDLVPPARIATAGGQSRYFLPLDFLAQAIGGTVTYDAIAGLLEIIAAPPPQFGDIFPPAGNVAQALLDSGYYVQQGEITKENLIDYCLAGYTPNANGNNVGVPYLGMQIPPSPYTDSLFTPPISFNFEADEAMVLIGKTPPECKYYSYRSYLMNRLYDFPTYTRIKINASLGEMTNLYRMRPDLPLDSMFGRKFALIMAGDSLLAKKVKLTILAATPEIAEADIHFDILPPEGMFQFGLDPQADWGMFAHRISLFKDSTEQETFVNNPPLEIMRITPKQPIPQVPFSLHSFLPRTCGTNEFELLPKLNTLEEGIYDAWHADYEMIWLQPSPWVIEGYVAIQQGMDALGDNHDALYIITSNFQFRENDIALVYGVDHVKTGKAVYTNATIYSTKYMAGYGGITNTQMEHSARVYVNDTVVADQLYAWCFSRHPIPGNPNVYIVPSDTNGTMEGINVNDTANFGFRLYVNTLTKIGPDPMEVILDQAVLLRPFSAGISDNKIDRQSPEIKVYPNPVTDKATLEFTVPDWSDITLSLYDQNGRQVGQLQRIDHVKGSVLQEIRLSGNLPAGIFYIRGVVTGSATAGSYGLTGTIVFSGGN